MPTEDEIKQDLPAKVWTAEDDVVVEPKVHNTSTWKTYQARIADLMEMNRRGMILRMKDPMTKENSIFLKFVLQEQELLNTAYEQIDTILEIYGNTPIFPEHMFTESFARKYSDDIPNCIFNNVDWAGVAEDLKATMASFVFINTRMYYEILDGGQNVG